MYVLCLNSSEGLIHSARSCDLCVIYYTFYKITEKQAFVVSNQFIWLINLYKKKPQNVLFKKRDTIDLIKKLEFFSRRNFIKLFLFKGLMVTRWAFKRNDFRVEYSELAVGTLKFFIKNIHRALFWHSMFTLYKPCCILCENRIVLNI